MRCSIWASRKRRPRRSIESVWTWRMYTIASTMPGSATGGSDDSPPVSSTAARPCRYPSSATAFATSTACSGSDWRTVTRWKNRIRGCEKAFRGKLNVFEFAQTVKFWWPHDQSDGLEWKNGFRVGRHAGCPRHSLRHSDSGLQERYRQYPSALVSGSHRRVRP